MPLFLPRAFPREVVRSPVRIAYPGCCTLLQRRLGLPDASVTVLLGFAFVALIGCETLRNRNFWSKRRG